MVLSRFHTDAQGIYGETAFLIGWFHKGMRSGKTVHKGLPAFENFFFCHKYAGFFKKQRTFIVVSPFAAGS